jgi:hypothetical protein
MIKLKIGGKIQTLKEHYKNKIEQQWVVLENGIPISAHTFPLNFIFRKGSRFKTNGHDYEVIDGNERN